MKPLRLLPASGFVAALLLALPAAAQRSATARAIFYTEPGYRGESLVVEAGAVVENLEFVRDRRGRALNDRISSVRFEGPVRAAIFEHSQFRGAFTWISRDIPDLSAHSLGDQRSAETWNENVSSLQVEALKTDGPRDFVAWERRDAERAVRATFRDYLGRDPDAQGLRFYTGRLMDAGWSEEQLRDAFRRSDEFRTRDVDAIIRKTYREVLGRDPDPSGLAAYRRGLGRGMTEPQMRAELGRSREAAEFRARETITRVYREMLKRDPDADGLATHTKAFLEKGWDEGRLREAIRRGDEYRKLRGN
ncbi:MAG: DUF4214 domain-containing protein [Verrucomicrobia bacterium]|nr:DUF4214 domain-containing protein [Verrucomicrobiota bacterium]